MRTIYQIKMLRCNEDMAEYVVGIDKNLNDEEIFGLYQSIVKEAFQNPRQLGLLNLALQKVMLDVKNSEDTNALN